LAKIRKDDKVLLSLYRDFVLSLQKREETSNDSTIEECEDALIGFIQNQIKILELQLRKGKGLKRFEYLTERIMYWKNVLMYQFNRYQDTAPSRPPSLFPAKTAIANPKPIEALADQILAAKHDDPNANISAMEAEIDRLVYDLYGLTEEEIGIVEESMGK